MKRAEGLERSAGGLKGGAGGGNEVSMGQKQGAGDVGGWKGVPVARNGGPGDSRRVAGTRKGVSVDPKGAWWVENGCRWLETRQNA